MAENSQKRPFLGQFFDIFQKKNFKKCPRRVGGCSDYQTTHPYGHFGDVHGSIGARRRAVEQNRFLQLLVELGHFWPKMGYNEIQFTTIPSKYDQNCRIIEI